MWIIFLGSLLIVVGFVGVRHGEDDPYDPYALTPSDQVWMIAMLVGACVVFIGSIVAAVDYFSR